MKILFTIATALISISAMAEVTLDGATFIRSSTTVSEKVTGSGYYVVTDGATLTLSNAANDFTGGVIVSNGVVQADAAGALGTGDIILHKEPGENLSQVIFNAANTTFANNIIKTAKGSSASYPDICTTQPNITLTGNISLECENATSSDYLFISAGSAGMKIADETRSFPLTIRGNITLGGGRVVFYAFKKNNSSPITEIKIYGKMSGYGIFSGWASNHQGTMYIYNPANDLKTFSMKLFAVHLMDTNVIRNAAITGCGAGQNVGGEIATFHLHGHDQIVGTLSGEGDAGVDSSVWTAKTVGFFSKESPATVTVVGPGSGTTHMVMIDKVNLKIAYPDDRLDRYQDFRRRWSTTYGDIEVASGHMRMSTGKLKDYQNNYVGDAESARFSNASNLTVGVKGVLELNAVTNSFPSLANVELNGMIQVGRHTGSEIFGPHTVMRVGAEGRFCVYGGVTNTIEKLYVNGNYMPPGIYTKDKAPWMVHPTASNPNTYSGALVVTKGFSGFVLTYR